VLEVRPKPVESIRYRSDLVVIGKFRCTVSDPLYRNSGPCSAHTFAFPRTSTAIRHDGGPAFIGSPNDVSYSTEGQVYFREPVSEIDATDWYAIAPAVLLDAVRHYDAWVDDRPERPFPFAWGPAPSDVYVEQRALFENVGSLTALHIEESVLSILDDILSRAFRTRTDDSQRTRDSVEAAKRTIAAAPGRNLSLSEIAATAHTSPFHLCRAFRNITGETMTSFRRNLRLRLALDRLRDTAEDLTGIALDLGFASHSHFTAAFRRQFGTTPSRFRALGAAR
jgi:AraC-like DNA-binding protein